jgi:TonB family protein
VAPFGITEARTPVAIALRRGAADVIAPQRSRAASVPEVGGDPKQLAIERSAEPAGPETSPRPVERAAAVREAQRLAADPAPMSDSEIDPFSEMGSATFRAGKVEARTGRQVRTSRPRLSLGARYELLKWADPQVILKVKIDASGNVTSVDVLRSSGSSDLDLACQQAMYEWWIEPPRDASGNAVPDVMVWHLHWR